MANKKAFQKEVFGAGGYAKSTMNSAMKTIGKYVATAFSIRAVANFGKECVRVANETQNAWRGLSSIINGQGKSFSEAQSFIQDYISDGLVPLNNAVTAYKNLTARGYNQEQVASVMNALKNSATYGRQASYTLGDAVQSATEGLKNENSILVDNAGVTKNVAKMWDEYARSIGTTANKLTQQQKIQAEVNGILKETQWQMGDAANYTSTFSGRVAKLSATFTSLKTSIGDMIIAVINPFIPYVQMALDYVVKLSNAIRNLMGAMGFEMPSMADLGGITGTTSAALDAADAIESTGDAATSAAKKAKRAFASFDEINQLTFSSSSGGSSGTSSGGSGSTSSPIIDNSSVTAAQSTNTVLDSIKQKLLDICNITGLSGLWSDFLISIENVKLGIQNLWDAFSVGIENNKPSLDNLKSSFVTTFSTVSNTVTGILGDMWVSLSNGFLMFTEENRPAIETFFTNIVGIITTHATLISTIWGDMFASIGEWWNSSGKPIFDGIIGMFQDVGKKALDIYNNYLFPVINVIQSELGTLWKEHLKPLWDSVLGLLTSIGNCALMLWNNYLSPIVGLLINIWGPAFKNIFSNVAKFVKDAIGVCVDVVKGLVNNLKSVITFITAVFSGDWKKAWQSIKDIFSNSWNTLWSVVKGVVNCIIDAVNALWSSVYGSVRAVINSLGGVVSSIGKLVGKDWGFAMPGTPPMIPRLAQGGWVAANSPRLAIIGDNTREGEIVTPESKIREQVVAALKEFKAGVQTVQLQLEILIKYPDGRQIIKKINQAQIEEGRILLEV